MIDVRKTLENLHQILPDLSLEDLFRVLDNIVEIPQFNIGNYRTIDSSPSSPLSPYNRDTYISYATSTTNEGISKQLER